jgi:hypothetical protein
MLIEYNPQLETPPRESPLGLGTFVLKPGKDDYNPTQWNAVLKNPFLKKQVQRRMDQKIIVILNEADETDLRDFNVTEAAAIIEDTFDIDLLERWKEADTRKGVLRDIGEQIAKINAAGTAGAEDDDEEDKT